MSQFHVDQDGQRKCFICILHTHKLYVHTVFCMHVLFSYFKCTVHYVSVQNSHVFVCKVPRGPALCRSRQVLLGALVRAWFKEHCSNKDNVTWATCPLNTLRSLVAADRISWLAADQNVIEAHAQPLLTVTTLRWWKMVVMLIQPHLDLLVWWTLLGFVANNFIT